jgi:hypothetical protein
MGLIFSIVFLALFGYAFSSFFYYAIGEPFISDFDLVYNKRRIFSFFSRQLMKVWDSHIVSNSLKSAQNVPLCWVEVFCCVRCLSFWFTLIIGFIFLGFGFVPFIAAIISTYFFRK